MPNKVPKVAMLCGWRKSVNLKHSALVHIRKCNSQAKRTAYWAYVYPLTTSLVKLLIMIIHFLFCTFLDVKQWITQKHRIANTIINNNTVDYLSPTPVNPLKWFPRTLNVSTSCSSPASMKQITPRCLQILAYSRHIQVSHPAVTRSWWSCLNFKKMFAHIKLYGAKLHPFLSTFHKKSKNSVGKIGFYPTGKFFMKNHRLLWFCILESNLCCTLISEILQRERCDLHHWLEKLM